MANTIRIGDSQQTMAYMKKLFSQEEVLWENERYRFEFGWGWSDLRLKSKSEGQTIARFSLDNVEVVDMINKMAAFL